MSNKYSHTYSHTQILLQTVVLEKTVRHVCLFTRTLELGQNGCGTVIWCIHEIRMFSYFRIPKSGRNQKMTFRIQNEYILSTFSYLSVLCITSQKIKFYKMLIK